MGSKDFIAEKILNALPPADHFYDLFGGGFSMSHCALVMKKYKHVHYNEIDPDTVQLVKDAIAGKYSYENFKPEWISRAKFFAEKDANAYIRIVWSFGNDQKTYLFSEEREGKKRSLHQAVVFGEFDEFAKSVLGFDQWPDDKSIYQRRIYCGRKVCMRKGELQQLQQLERLGRLEQLERLQQPIMTSLSYEQVEIKPNSIIYCDPPYRGTKTYLSEFDHGAFINWVIDSPHPIFFSEYADPRALDERLELVFQKSKRQLLSKKTFGSERGIERVFANQAGVQSLLEWKKGGIHGKTRT